METQGRYMQVAGRLLRRDIAALADFCGIEAKCHKGWIEDTWIFSGDKWRLDRLKSEMKQFERPPRK